MSAVEVRECEDVYRSCCVGVCELPSAEGSSYCRDHEPERKVGCLQCLDPVEVDVDSGLCPTCLWGPLPGDEPARPEVSVIDLSQGVECGECGEMYPAVCPDLCGTLHGSIPSEVWQARRARRRPFPIGTDGRVVA